MATAAQIIRRRHARRDRRAAQRGRGQLWSWLGVLAAFLLIGVPVGVLIGGAAYVYAQAIEGLPTPAQTTFQDSASVTRILDRTGDVLLFAVSDPLGSDREWTRLDDLPDYLRDATLITEDPDFLQTTRFDPLDTLTRLWRNIMVGPIESDTSLTARLIRNVIAPPPQTPTAEYRSREIALVAEINRRYPPASVLEWHLNTNYYGSEAYGIEAAAQVYLGKPARALTLDEAALLASIPTAPQFNPFDDETAARGRQSDTLRRLLSTGLISQADYDQAAGLVTVIRPGGGSQPQRAPEYSYYARRQAETLLDSLGLDGARAVSRGGLTITTALDVPLYEQAACALDGQLALMAGQPADWRTSAGQPCLSADALRSVTAVEAGRPPDTGSVVVLDVSSGELLAMVGPANRADSQPGYTLAPFVIFEGFRDRQQGVQYSPASMLLDIPRRFPGASEGLIYQPANPDATFIGPVSLRQAAAQMLLPPVVQIADNHGLTNILRTARRLGLNTLNEGLYDLSLLERGGLVAPLDIAYAYSVLSSQGSMSGVPIPARASGLRNRDPVAVLKIQDAEGRVLWEYRPEQWRVNLFSDAPELGYLVNHVFSDYALRQAKFGATSPLLTSRPSATVTALTSDGKDNWTVGYSPQRVISVHLTRTDTASTGLSGYAPQAASALWRALFDQIHDGLTPVEWPRPSQIAEITVCERSGLLPHDNCPTRRELIIAGIQPTRQDTFWQAVEINSQTRQRATANTPAALRVTETYFVPPDDALDWWRANRQPLPPEDYDTFSRPDNAPFSTTAITRPEPLAWVRGAIEIRGVVNTERLRFYQMAYGAGVNPTDWIAIGASQPSMPENGVLGVWDTTGLDGIFTLELAAVLTDGTRERAVVQLRVDNVPPTVAITAVEPGKVYRFPADASIPLTAITADNLVLDRVEMYAAGRLVATLTDAPYTYSHPISSVGSISFNAVAFDAAGNQSESTPLLVEVIR